MSATDVVLYTVLPVLGCFLVLGLSLSPLQALQKCEAEDDIGEFNPLPPCLFLMCNLVWVLNGVFVGDVYVFLINAIMVSVNLHLTMRSYRMADRPKRQQVEFLLHSFLWVAMLFGFAFLYQDDYQQTLDAYGWLCGAFNMAIFVPPMFLVGDVIARKDAAAISAPFAAVGCVCCSFWCLYAVLIELYEMAIPNAFGLALSVIQVTLTLLYPAGGGKSVGGGTHGQLPQKEDGAGGGLPSSVDSTTDLLALSPPRASASSTPAAVDGASPAAAPEGLHAL